MKKIIFILLALMLTVTACGEKKETSTKTEEQLRAEIKAELEAEAKQKEEEANKQKEQNKKENTQLENKSDDENNNQTKDKHEENNQQNNQEDNKEGDSNDSSDSKDVNVENSNGNSMPKTIAGQKVLEFELTKEAFHLRLEGKFTGLLGTVMYDDYYESYTLNVTNLPGMVSYNYTLGGRDTMVIPPTGTYVLDKEYVEKVLDQEAIAQINAGKPLNVDCEISNYEYSEKVGSENGTSGKVKITSFEKERADSNINDDSHSMPDVYLSGFENETLYSEDNQIDIDYSKYSLVIVPMQESKNLGKLTQRVVNVTETEQEGIIKFSVFGKLINVKLEYVENGMDSTEKPKEIFIADEIENECVLLNATMPTDFSSIKITAHYQYVSSIEEISFSLDDMRDPETYKILTVDAYSFPNEDY